MQSSAKTAKGLKSRRTQSSATVMFSFEKVKCWPSHKVKTFCIEWYGYGTENVSFDVLVTFNNGETFTKVVSTDHVSVEATVMEHDLNFFDDTKFQVNAVNQSGVVGSSILFSPAPSITNNIRLSYKEIMRRSELDMSKYIGQKDILILKAKRHGDLASNINPILEAPIGIEDQESFGKKFKGGYLKPIKSKGGYMVFNKGDKGSKTQEHGISDPRKIAIMLLPFPTVDVGDLIIDVNMDDRFLIEAIKTSAFFNLPVKQIAQLSLLPRSDEAYSIDIK